MRRKLFLLAVAAAALASCSSDETLSVNQGLEDANTISFRPAIQGMTRAANGTGLKTTPWENGDILYVNAIRNTSPKTMYFQDEFVKDNVGFNSSAKHFWPNDIATNKIYFTAFWGASYKTVSPSTNYAANDEYKLGTTYTVPDDVASQKDLLFAKSATLDDKPTDGKVTLNFRHMLSQVCVKVANSEANLKITITGVRVGYLNKAGNFSYTGDPTTDAVKIARGNWSLTDDASKNASYLFQQNVTSTVLSGTTAAQPFVGGFTPWILMPQDLTEATAYTSARGSAGPVDDSAKDLNGAYLALKMTIADNTTSAEIVADQWCYWPIGTEWKPGYKYTYTINAGSGGYQPTDQNNNTDLDPVLGGLVIWFSPTCTIDAWVEDNTGVSEPAVAVTDKTTAGTPLTYNVAAGTHGTYTIVVTGLTPGNTVAVTGSNNIVAPTVSATTVDASGRVVITGTLSANKDDAVTSVITLTESNSVPSTVTTTTITVNQAAATTL